MPNSSCEADDRPPVAGAMIVAMRPADLEQVLQTERDSFLSPWKREHFLHEIVQNEWAVNLVARRGDELLAYACLWIIEGELKINNFAVRGDLRGTGVGDWLLQFILRKGWRMGCEEASLEVRETNVAALRLYRKHGFHEVGRRKKYYQQENEDAIVMVAERPIGRT